MESFRFKNILRKAKRFQDASFTQSWMVFLTLCMVILTGCYVIVTWRTLKAINESTKISAKQLSAFQGQLAIVKEEFDTANKPTIVFNRQFQFKNGLKSTDGIPQGLISGVEYSIENIGSIRALFPSFIVIPFHVRILPEEIRTYESYSVATKKELPDILEPGQAIKIKYSAKELEEILWQHMKVSGSENLISVSGRKRMIRKIRKLKPPQNEYHKKLIYLLESDRKPEAFFLVELLSFCREGDLKTYGICKIDEMRLENGKIEFFWEFVWAPFFKEAVTNDEHPLGVDHLKILQ